MKYKITVYRTEVREVEIEVEADSQDAAENAAIDKAGDVDFTDRGRLVSVEYSL